MSFACAVRIELTAPARELAIDEPAAEFSYRGHSVTIKGDGPTLRGSRDLLFVASGFRSQESALDLGVDLRGHLRLVGMCLRMSFDVGASQSVEDRRSSTIGPDGVQVVAPVDGLTVYEQTDNDKLLIARSGGFRASAPLALLADALIEMSEFRPACADFVVESDLDPREKDSLRGRLKDLKKQSIRRSLRALVEDLGPATVGAESAGEFIDRCYRYRSALVHGQVPPPSDRDLSAAFEALRPLAEHVILRHVSPS